MNTSVVRKGLLVEIAITNIGGTAYLLVLTCLGNGLLQRNQTVITMNFTEIPGAIDLVNNPCKPWVIRNCSAPLNITLLISKVCFYTHSRTQKIVLILVSCVFFSSEPRETNSKV